MFFIGKSIYFLFKNIRIKSTESKSVKRSFHHVAGVHGLIHCFVLLVPLDLEFFFLRGFIGSGGEGAADAAPGKEDCLGEGQNHKCISL